MFDGKHVLITGASSGIGVALARRLAASGARTVIVARREERLRALADEITAAGHPQPVVVVADLFEAQATERVFEQAVSALGHIDVLVNNAGLGHHGPFHESEPGRIEEMLALNVRSLVRLTHLVLPGMIERGSGWILNIGSVAAYQTLPYLSVYSATKAFVLNFSEGLWAELRGSGVRVTCANPGTTRTEFFDRHERLGLRRMLLKNAMSADRVAKIALRALARGKPVVVCGYANLLATWFMRVLPRRRVTSVVARVMRPQD
ncbi:MAG: SDR family oxidoreductase [Planctomycetes bacterium]|nr:SDR family oxidoreductase [Planctomycetota bacterium]